VTVWRGTTTEERAEVRRAQLLDAAFELLGAHGIEGTTVRGVCAGAGLNPRYFYESFEDLDALVGAVYDRVADEAWGRSLEAIIEAPDSAEAKTRAALGASIRYVGEDERRIRILFREGGPVLHERRTRAITIGADQIADLASGFLGVARDDKLLATSSYMLAGGLTQLMVAWQNGSVQLTVDELVDHATAMVMGTSQAMGRMVKHARS
jgi:AcrR family transcriptional regulator